MRDQDQHATDPEAAESASAHRSQLAVSTDWQQLRDSLQALGEWCRDLDWVASLSFDMAIAPEFETWVTARVGSFAAIQPSGEALSNAMAALRADTEVALERARNATDPVTRWGLYRSAYARYGFTETVIEASGFSDAVLARTMAALGADGLSKLAVIDTLNPSILTSFAEHSSSNIDIGDELLTSAAVQDYLTLKKWQDDQHNFHDQVLHPEFRRAREDFDAWRGVRLPHLADLGARDALAAVFVSQQGLVRIEGIARLLQANIAPALGAVVGGKALGLARLMLAEHAAPDASVLSVDASLREDALDVFNTGLWAVRSSATVEDGENASFAGMFTSELAVTPKELPAAIGRVRASVATPRVKAYVEQFHTAQPHMAVVIQEFRLPSFAGVWLGRDLTSGRLEWVNGDGEKLVSGHVTPTGEEWTHNQPPAGPVTSSVGPVGELCLKLQNRIGVVADLEWAIIGNQIRWLQYRPVTRPLPENPSTVSETPGQLTGIAASAGLAVGPARIIDDPQGAVLELGSILIAPATDPDWVPLMMSAAAIITAEGGALSHAAIIARELGKPCVVGVRDAGTISPGTVVEVNGATGVITAVSSTN